jgi:hypothetical protein
MIIYIVSRVTRNLQLDTDNTITLLALKKMIEDARQIAVEEQVLTFRLNVIDDDMTLMHYNINNENVIFLSAK